MRKPVENPLLWSACFVWVVFGFFFVVVVVVNFMLKQVRQNPCGPCGGGLGALRKGKLQLQPSALGCEPRGCQPSSAFWKCSEFLIWAQEARLWRPSVCGHFPGLPGRQLAGWRKHCSLDQIPRFNRENASIDVFINLTVKVGTGTCCPGRLWMSQPWKCSRPGWIRPWATWSSGRGPCLWQGGLGLYL